MVAVNVPQSRASGTARSARHKLARWRPLCPECGYSLRRLTSDRCPERGEVFPTPSRVYRRWANRRLPWERRNHGGVVFTYLGTMLLILLRPTRAARGVAIPDHLGKALRWAVVHLVVLALLATVFISQPYFQYLMFAPNRSFFTTIEPSTANLAEWSAYSLLAWLIALSSYPLLGVALATAVPGRHPAARRGIVKWTLYSSASISLGVGGALAVAMFQPVMWILSSMGVAQPGWYSWYRTLLHALDWPWLSIWALVYGCWWAMGVAGNVYLRRRGWLVFLGNALVYITTWLALAKVLFPPWELGALM